MKNTFIIICFILGCCSIKIYGQQNITLSGIISDAQTGEALIGASVLIKTDVKKGTISNEYGFYSLTIPKGKYIIQFNYLGYESVIIDSVFKVNTRIDISLPSISKELTEIKITDEESNNIVNKSAGVEKIELAQMNKVPVIFGERDYLKTIQLLPGVQPASEGSSGFNVRGGSSDQNLIILDEAIVYNPSHLLGFFSSFNADAVKEVTLYKGIAPANYGGRVSSVLDVRMNDGDKKKYHVGGGIGLISAHVFAEGPLWKDKASFLVAGRRTFADLFTQLSSNDLIKGTTLYFYDINTKLNIQLGKKSKLMLSGYFGEDELGLSDFKLKWHNAIATARFNHIISGKIFSNTSFIFSDYQSTIVVDPNNAGVKLRSEIMDFSLKQEFQFFISAKHTLKAGIGSTYHIIAPGEIDGNGFGGFGVADISYRYSIDNAFYATAESSFAPWMKLNYGLRLVSFHAVGPGNFYRLDQQQNVSDTLTLSNFESAADYYNFEPRIAVSIIPTEKTSIKFGYARHTQFIHLLANSVASNPTDKWIPSSNNVKPEISDQFSAGVFQQIKSNMFDIGIEGYYKLLQNQIDYKDGADVLTNELYEKDLLSGDGRTYGLELMVRKNKGDFTGWISYTLSRSERKINGINDFNWYPARQDRTHSLNVVLMYQYKRWTFSGTFVYYTGNAVTFPSGKYQVNNDVVYLYTERNGYRMPDYHRLDLGVTVDLLRKKLKPLKNGKERKPWLQSEISFGAYNVYNRYNTYRITFRENDNNQTEAVSTALFGIVPYVGFNFKL
jgi:hypothetical protein